MNMSIGKSFCWVPHFLGWDLWRGFCKEFFSLFGNKFHESIESSGLESWWSQFRNVCWWLWLAFFHEYVYWKKHLDMCPISLGPISLAGTCDEVSACKCTLLLWKINFYESKIIASWSQIMMALLVATDRISEGVFAFGYHTTICYYIVVAPLAGSPSDAIILCFWRKHVVVIVLLCWYKIGASDGNILRRWLGGSTHTVVAASTHCARWECGSAGKSRSPCRDL